MKTVKPVAPATSATPPNPEPAMRVLKTGTCPSLSGKSKLTYQIGCMGKSDIQLRISANSGGGFFSDDWVSLSDIQEALDKAPSGKPITSFVLNKLSRGKSMNTPGFLFAALKQEGLVQASQEKQRCYERGDLKGFMESVKALSNLTDEPKDKPLKVADKHQKAAANPKQATSRTATASSKKKAPAKSSAKKKA